MKQEVARLGLLVLWALCVSLFGFAATQAIPGNLGRVVGAGIVIALTFALWCVRHA